jgi:hypothetical protein
LNLNKAKIRQNSAIEKLKGTKAEIANLPEKESLGMARYSYI